MKRKIFYMIALLAATTGVNAQSVSVGAGATVSDVNLVREADAMVLSMDIDVSAMKVARNRDAVLTPVFTFADGDSTAFPSVRIMGRKRYLYNLRNKLISKDDPYVYRAGRVTNIAYRESAAYEDRMNGAELEMQNSLCGCREKLIETTPYALAKYKEYTPEYVYVQPAAETMKERHIEGSAYIDFRVNKTDIDPAYRRNADELAKIRATIDSVRDDADITIAALTLKGFASPESPYAHNEQLAVGRTEALKVYVQNLYHFAPDVISTDHEAEDWAGLRAFVERSGLEHRGEILALIDSELEPDAKEAKIKAAYPDEYRFLLNECYPALRHTDYRVNYIIRSFSDADEIRRIFETQPGKLSLNEMYILAQSLEPGSEEFDEVFETAVRMYPGDEAANINAANVAMKRGDLAAAQHLLDKAGDAPEADYARGTLAFLLKDADAAKAYMQSAADKGIEAANRYLECIE